MAKPEHDPDVVNEPHVQGGPAQGDSTEAKAQATLRSEAQRGGVTRQQALQSVFEEPHSVTTSNQGPSVITDDAYCANCGYNLRGLLYGQPCPECGQTIPVNYADWLRRKQAEVTDDRSWLITIFAAVIGGPLAIIGALWAGAGPLAIIVFAPLAEEVLKISAVLMIVEVWPYLFRRASQIRLAALGGALGFAVIENVIYLNVYVLNYPVNDLYFLTVWRWTVCTALHVGCTTIAMQGVVRVWQRTNDTAAKPQIGRVVPWIVAAAIVHGSYNAFAVVLELVGFTF